ncbi:hypothetical protein NUH88_04150 [Nisaea acidiphila]|uniref:Calcium-binding protein n=1 Tax=Nisaea acidiphila TaxID=1862145 RepID=A0A9J7AUV0_9PROT|nr:hypothetical protein [Nisaea acidiphila]UUX50894.1 hypothetical protein NUH88_04150 [Nisaea acidiphila]
MARHSVCLPQGYVVYGVAGSVTVSGNDAVYGGTGNDPLKGSEGSDTPYGTFDADSVIGGASYDALFGDTCTDVPSAGGGDHYAEGAGVVYSGTRNDVLYVGLGRGLFIGDGEGDAAYVDQGAGDMEVFVVGGEYDRGTDLGAAAQPPRVNNAVSDGV